MDKLLRALPTQSQLETVEIAFRGSIFHDWEGSATVASCTEVNDDVEPEIHGVIAQVQAKQYRLISAISTQMFLPAWVSVCRLLEDGHMSTLRYNMA